MRAGDGPPPVHVDLRERGRAHGDLTGADLAPVHDQAAQRDLDVEHLDLAVRAPAVAGHPDDPAVRQLATAFGVERGAVQHHRDRFALPGRLDRQVVDQQADHGGLAGEPVVAGELAGARALAQIGQHRDVGVAGLLLGRVGLGPVALDRHQPPEAFLVDRQPLLLRHLQGQLDREPVGVVQLERLLTGQPDGLLAPGLLHRRVEDRGAGAQRAEERRLLRVQHGVDVGRVAAQLWVQRRHRLDGGLTELVQEVLVAAGAAAAAAPLAAGQHAQVADAAAQDPPQHVAAALVAGQHPVLDQHDRGTHVVGHDLQRDVGSLVDAVALLGELGRAVQDLVGGVDLVDVVDALQDGRHPLQAHPGVHVAERQRAPDVEVGLAADRAQLVLHEDQVPDLQVAVLVRLRAALLAVLDAAVVVDLRARAAGAGHAHVPVVVGQAAALDAVLGQLDHVAPDRVGLVVVVQHRGPQPVLGEAEPAVVLGAGQQLPGVRDGHVLEVVAERPVAEHLEEGGVPGRPADLFDVTGAHALLHVGGTLVGRRLLAEQVRLERLHPGDDEQHRRVVGDQ